MYWRGRNALEGFGAARIGEPRTAHGREQNGEKWRRIEALQRVRGDVVEEVALEKYEASPKSGKGPSVPPCAQQ